MDKIEFAKLMTKYVGKVNANTKATWDYYDSDQPVWARAMTEMMGDLFEEVQELKKLMGVEK